MNWNELEKIWQEQPATGVSTPLDVHAKQELIAGFEKKSRKRARALWRRDWIELIACVWVAGIWGMKWWKFGEAAWPLVISIGLIIGVMVFFARELVRRRKMTLPAHACLAAKVAADLAELRHQHKLLKSVGTWYIAPIAIGILVELNVRVRLGDGPKTLAELGASLGMFALISWGVWWLNQRAVRKRIEPDVIELARLEAQLLGGAETKQPEANA